MTGAGHGRAHWLREKCLILRETIVFFASGFTTLCNASNTIVNTRELVFTAKAGFETSSIATIACSTYVARLRLFMFQLCVSKCVTSWGLVLG